jgi:hypothetical protein
MNLSRRAKLDREAPTRGAPNKARPAAVAAAPVVPVPDEPEAAPAPPDAPPVPTPAVAAEVPKRARFVRPAAEKREAAKAAALPPRSTKSSGKMMSKNVTAAPTGGPKAAKGPKVERGPIANTHKR